MTFSDTDPAQSVAEIGDHYWRAYLEMDPFTATSVGAPGFDDKVPDPSRQAGERFAAILGDLAAQLDSVDVTAADRDTRINWSFLHTRIHNQRVRILSDVDAVSISGSIGGLLSQLISDVSPARIDNPDAASAFAERLSKLGGYIAAVGERQQQAQTEGRNPTALGVQQAIDQLDLYLSSPLDGDPFLKPVRGDNVHAQAARERAENAVSGVLRPALASYRDLLRGHFLATGRDDEHVGLCHVPGGAAAYETLIRHFTTTDMSAEQVFAEGTELIARLHDEVRAAGRLAFGVEAPQQILSHLRDDNSLRFQSEQHELDYARHAYQRAVDALGGWFRDYDLPECDIQPMNLVQARSGITGYYTNPADDGSRPGPFWVNTFEPENRPIATLESVAFHESVPGHHLQRLVGSNNDLPVYRRYLSSIAHREGWGLYVERLADEMQLYSSAVARLGMLSSSLWRASRLVIDTGIHAFGWSRARAVAYLSENTSLSVTDVANEVDRYIAVPGQALSYMIGQRCVERLRDACSAKLGPAFSLPEFHHCVLRDGTMPLATLTEVVDDWARAYARQGSA